MLPREIYCHHAFYRDRLTGEVKRKFFVVLARLPSEDLVVRLLTSRSHGRPETPPCFHGMPYPGFYLGVLGGRFGKESWLDLRYLDDFDPSGAVALRKRSVLEHEGTLAPSVFPALLDCAARADDTTKAQERAMRDELARLS